MQTMDFTKAVDRLLDGDKVRRQEWSDDGTYIIIDDEKIKIFTPEDKGLHPLVVSTGDLLGTDWVVVPKMKLAY
jgi:hypothetical protein